MRYSPFALGLLMAVSTHVLASSDLIQNEKDASVTTTTSSPQYISIGSVKDFPLNPLTPQSIELDFFDVNVDQSDFFKLTQCVKVNTLVSLILKSSSLDRNMLVTLCDASADNTSVVNVEYYGANFLPYDNVFKLLKNFKSLDRLFFSGRVCGAKQTFSLGRMIEEKGSESLSQITLSDNFFYYDDLQFLFEVLGKKKNLKEFNLWNAGVDLSKIRFFDSVFESNKESLHTLSLNENDLGDENIVALVPFLRGNSVLKKLCLQSCNLTAGNVTSLLEALEGNDTLESLSLCGNTLDIRAVNALSGWISGASHLRVLDLRNTSLGDAEAKILSESILVSRTLKEVYFEGNKINRDLSNRGAFFFLNAPEENFDSVGFILSEYEKGNIALNSDGIVQLIKPIGLEMRVSF